jgi:hypothetical protein
MPNKGHGLDQFLLQWPKLPPIFFILWLDLNKQNDRNTLRDRTESFNYQTVNPLAEPQKSPL